MFELTVSDLKNLKTEVLIFDFKEELVELPAGCKKQKEFNFVELSSFLRLRY